jgi:hypothetical protein
MKNFASGIDSAIANENVDAGARHGDDQVNGRGSRAAVAVRGNGAEDAKGVSNRRTDLVAAS